jgi:hypothetical protein
MAAQRPTRRALLASLVGLGALLAAGAGWRWRTRLSWIAKRVRELPLGPEARIAKHFDYLDLDPDGLARFVADWERYIGPLSRWRTLPPEIHTRFLLSSDFFRHGADESRRIGYVAFADPYVSICANPLAQFD